MLASAHDQVAPMAVVLAEVFAAFSDLLAETSSSSSSSPSFLVWLSLLQSCHKLNLDLDLAPFPYSEKGRRVTRKIGLILMTPIITQGRFRWVARRCSICIAVLVHYRDSCRCLRDHFKSFFVFVLCLLLFSKLCFSSISSSTRDHSQL